jgi:hypothetical protein
MSWRVVGLVVFVIVSAAIGITSTIVITSMVDEVNRKLPPEERLSPYGWYPGKLRRVAALYRRTYPDGRRHAQLLVLALVAGAAFVLGAACILFPT